MGCKVSPHRFRTYPTSGCEAQRAALSAGATRFLARASARHGSADTPPPAAVDETRMRCYPQEGRPRAVTPEAAQGAVGTARAWPGALRWLRTRSGGCVG